MIALRGETAKLRRTSTEASQERVYDSYALLQAGRQEVGFNDYYDARQAASRFSLFIVFLA